VCDNGPTPPADPEGLLALAGAGVGLVNMRDRLSHLYRSRQTFTVKRREPTGLSVIMTLPFETRQQIAAG
jgi:LytS/YehU family sensor histidine kinase